jgi:hypothetical protein
LRQERLTWRPKRLAVALDEAAQLLQPTEVAWGRRRPDRVEQLRVLDAWAAQSEAVRPSAVEVLRMARQTEVRRRALFQRALVELQLAPLAEPVAEEPDGRQLLCAG